MYVVSAAEELVGKVIGKQRVKSDTSYRLMKYVITRQIQNQIVLQNVITGQLVMLEQNEENMIRKLPCSYSPFMDQLIENYFLVPEDFNDTGKVVGLRKVVLALTDQKNNAPITFYMILPTTACNARCYYCFEHGFKPENMSKATADSLVEFIRKHHGGYKIRISWFGGEPTLGADRIDYICEQLRSYHIDYVSEMISNGYLMDAALIDRAVNLWHLKEIQITVDGMNENYKKVKAYVLPDENPFEHVMNNISLLCEHQIHVAMRMNYDLVNRSDCELLLDYVKNRFKQNRYLHLSFHPILGEYADCSGNVNHGSSEWYQTEEIKMNELMKSNGFKKAVYQLPALKYEICFATNKSAVVVSPDGTFYCCPDKVLADYRIGNVHESGIDIKTKNLWKEITQNSLCTECVLYPSCGKLARCGESDRCNTKLCRLKEAEDAMDFYTTRYFKQHHSEGGETNDFS